MKITQEKMKKGQELYQKLVQKSWDSAAFKAQLISNPKTTISNEIGKSDINENIVVEDQTDANIVYLNIPAKPDLDSFELSEEELNHVSGGGDTNTCSTFELVEFTFYAAGQGYGIAAREIASWF